MKSDILPDIEMPNCSVANRFTNAYNRPDPIRKVISKLNKLSFEWLWDVNEGKTTDLLDFLTLSDANLFNDSGKSFIITNLLCTIAWRPMD